MCLPIQLGGKKLRDEDVADGKSIHKRALSSLSIDEIMMIRGMLPWNK
jgi:hypothetical protein